MSRVEPSVPIETLLHHRDWVRHLAVSMADDAASAADVEQQTWLRVLESPPRHAGGLRTWLARVVRSQALNSVRSMSRRASHEASGARSAVTRSTANVVAEAECHDRLVAAVMRLDEPYRTTVLLRFYEDLPPRDVAARMGVPVETVRTRVRRALATLRETMGRGRRRDEWLGAIAPLLITGHDAGAAVGASTATAAMATTVATLTGGVTMAGSKTVVAAVALGCIAGFAGGRLGAPPAPEDASQELAAIQARVDALESAAPSRERAMPRATDGLEARVRALETGKVPDVDAALLAALENPSPALRKRLALALKEPSETEKDWSDEKKGLSERDKAGVKMIVAFIDGELDRWATDYGISSSQVDQLKQLTRTSIDDITQAKLEGASDRDVQVLEVETQAEVRRIVGDDVYVQTERDRVTREVRGLVPWLSSAVGLTPEQHRELDRALEDGVERSLPDIVRVRSVPMSDSEHETLAEELERVRDQDWERIRDEILTEEQRNRIPGK